MYEEERKAKIMELIRKHSRVDVQELVQLLKASESTIRRDLTELEEHQLLKRTHGGAVSLETVNFEPSFLEKEVYSQLEKRAIGKKAIEFINDGDTILLDSGTTTQYLVKELKAYSNLTIVTNAITFAQDLQHCTGVEVIFLGGSLRRGTLSLVGSFAEMCLSKIHVDKAFIATNGIDLVGGLTTPYIAEADIKQKMIQSASKVILLSDSSKIGKICFAKFGEIEDVDIMITDNHSSANVLNGYINKGVKVYEVDP